ncbi:MAG TPA: hypothetical protein VLA14_05375 [Polyangia bacterium]|nr:hypothetical protein [Polyangia bacterium]
MRTSRKKTAKLKVVRAKSPRAKLKAKATAKAKPKATAQAKPKATAKPKMKAARPTTAKAKRARPRPLRPAVLVKARKRSDDADAFIPDPGEGPARTRDDLAEVLAEDFIGAATSGNDVLEDDLERETSDELGGPFVVTSARLELADDVDASNPIGAEVEAFPRAVAGVVAHPTDERDDDVEPSDEHVR